MDCKDLMIGDLVQFDEDTCVIDELRVDGMAVLVAMNTDLTSVDGDQVDVEELSPIELTEEILVKNGFEKFAESQTNFDYTDNDIHLEYWVGDGVFRYYTAEIHYVHQLQHLLRLVGVQKEIEL